MVKLAALLRATAATVFNIESHTCEAASMYKEKEIQTTSTYYSM